jgi:hypothetical protein
MQRPTRSGGKANEHIGDKKANAHIGDRKANARIGDKKANAYRRRSGRGRGDRCIFIGALDE